jgi:predicted nuclease of predicted toxin-antitoxin system
VSGAPPPPPPPSTRLLFDHNLSPRLVERLGDRYPGAQHVAAVGLERATDAQVWAYAGAHGYAIVTKDSDFNDTVVLQGSPPKVVWLRLGNCTTGAIERVLRAAAETVTAFLADPAADLLELV